jgi:plastocyanin
MRSIRLLAAGLTIVAVAACATSTPGWTYAPAPSATPIPSADPSASAAASGSAAPSASAAPGASGSPGTGSAAPSGSAQPSGAPAGAVIDVSAQNIAFTPTELAVPPDAAFQINFANNDAGIPHNVEIKDGGGASLFRGEVFNGVATRTYDVPPLPAGAYQFICTVHPNMVGTLTVQ